MLTRVRLQLATISAASFLFLAAQPNETAAQIVLDNDVEVAWSNGFNLRECAGTTLCRRPVVGAPRLVTDASVASEPLNILIAIAAPADTSPVTIVKFDLIVRRATFECLERIPPGGCLTRLTLRGRAQIPINFSDFPLELGLNDFDGFFPEGDKIIAVDAQFQLSGRLAPVTTTLSGAGNEVAINRVGDLGFSRGDARDIPTRSVEVVRALDQIPSGLLPNGRIVELDAQSPSRRAIAGFTHTVTVPRHDDGRPFNTIKSATLSLRLKSAQGGSTNGFILLDRAVDRITGDATNAQRIPLVLLRDLAISTPRPDDTVDVTVDLEHVPVSVLSREGLALPRSRNLLADLNDDRLNVIVVGSQVDFSDLTVFLNDR